MKPNTCYYLKDGLSKKSNNLQLMKFLSAIAVIVAHAFPLSGNGDYDYLETLTAGQIDLGQLAVSIFFLTGGVLITKSMIRLKTARSYFYARIIRILPPLIVVVLLCILGGSLITQLTISEYYTSSETYKYLLNMILIPYHTLPGVFVHNEYISTVNGSLWTLPVEFLCYIACYIIYKLQGLKEKNILFFFLLYLALAVAGYRFADLYPQFETISALLQPCYFFLLGILCYTYKDKIPLRGFLFVASLIGTCAGFVLHQKYIAVWVFLPYLILYLAFMEKQISNIFSFLGNYSYTIYLCAFPIQQFITELYGGSMDLIKHLLLSIPCSVAVGVILFHAFEKPIVTYLQKKTRK